MRIVVNKQKVKRESLIGKIAIYGSLAILMGGLVLTLFGQQWGILTPENIGTFYLIYIVILFTGLIVSRVGMYYGNRHLSPRRPEKLLRENLKGLDKKYSLVLFSETTDYILAEPGGISAIIFKSQGGRVSYKNGKWNHSTSFITRLFGREEPIGDSKKEIDEALTRINAKLKEKMPNHAIPLRGIVLFGNPDVQLDLDTTPFAMIKVDKLKDYLRGAGKLKELPNSTQNAMREVLGVNNED
jgi:hypothetical protein